MTYTDQTVYRLLLQLAARDVTVTRIEFDPTDVATIACDGRRAAVWPSDDGTTLEWELLSYPTRRGRRWDTCGSGTGDDTEMRIAVLEHLNTAA